MTEQTQNSKQTRGSTATAFYAGLLSLHSWGEADDILFLSSETDPLAEVLQDRISRKMVTVRYWITDRQCNRDEAQEQFVKRLYGVADCAILDRDTARLRDICGPTKNAKWVAMI